MSKPHVIVIVGPTAVGKTKLSIDIAKIMNSEIISADSMQIYKYMDIGTAKPTKEEMNGIDHHLIDEITPDVEFSVAQYKKIAQGWIDTIISKNKVPIIVGGTGLYINSLVYNIQFSETFSNIEYRNKLSCIANEKGNKVIHDMLKEVDPKTAEKLHVNDTKRVIRALEVYNCTGLPISHHNTISKCTPSKYNYIIIGLTMDRKVLYDRINQRVDIMFTNGLIEEVKSLIKMGFTKDMTSMQGIGYKETIDYINGQYELNELKDIIKRESRRYAKRQITWFKRLDNIKWFDVIDTDYKNNLKNIHEYVAQNLEIM